ncbi:MAG: ArnT family glycosyltransferase [Terrimicrobiaceae bacterium]
MKSKTVLIFLGVLALGRIVWLATQGVAPQEAYYWMCGDRLAAAYFDGPPATAYLVRFLGFFTGGSLEILRLVWPLLALYVSWLAFLLARTIFNPAVAGWTTIAINALPIFNAQSVTVGPGMPALVCVLGGLLAAYSAIEGRRKDWIPAAACFALACLFRYEAVLVPLGFCITILAVLQDKKQPDWAAFAALIVLPLAVLWSPLAWNARLEWIPIAGGTLQTWWRPQPGGWSRNFIEFFREYSFAGGLALLAGLGVLGLGALKRGGMRFLLVAAGLPALWAVYQFLIGRSFSTGAWLALVPVLIALIGHFARSRWMPLAGSAVVVLALLQSAVMLREDGRMRGIWSSIAMEVHKATREIPASDGGGFLVAENTDLASVLAVFFKTSGQSEYPPVFVPESPALTSQFGLWPSYADFVASDLVVDEFFTEQKGYNLFAGRNALFLGSDLPQTIKGAFAQVSPLRKIQLPDGGELTIFLCLDYQTLPL